MSNNQVPLQIDGITESIYAGFWARLGSLLLDSVFSIPVIFLVLYLNGLGKNVYFYTLVPNLLFFIWYNIYLLKKYGGTPGKLVVGIKIIKLDGQAIGWKEAILRNVILLALTVLSCIVMTVCLIKADDATFTSLSWMKQTQYLMTLSPVFFKIYAWASNIWIYSEFIVLLTNKRKRAIHDFIAGTVIVKAKYIDNIIETMYTSVNTIDDPNSINLLPHYAD